MTLIVPPALSRYKMQDDYSDLSESVRELVYRETVNITTTSNRLITDVITIGRSLTNVKAGLSHGRWERYCLKEVGWDPRLAQRYMSVTRRFADIQYKFGVFPERFTDKDGQRYANDVSKECKDSIAWGRMAVGAIFAMAAPSTPDSVVTALIEACATGEHITLAKVKSAKRASKRAMKQIPPEVQPLAQNLAERGAALLMLPSGQPDGDLTKAAGNIATQIVEGNGHLNVNGNILPATMPVAPGNSTTPTLTVADIAVVHELNEVHADNRQRALDHLPEPLFKGKAKLVTAGRDGRVTVWIDQASINRLMAAQVECEVEAYLILTAIPKKETAL
jgi:hypothetical protein